MFALIFQKYGRETALRTCNPDIVRGENDKLVRDDCISPDYPFTEDSVALHNKSPLFHAKNITKPFIVLQGSNDPRVLQVESDEIVQAARDNNVPSNMSSSPTKDMDF